MVSRDCGGGGSAGAALARAIVADPRLSKTKLLGVTGMTESDVRETAFDSGIAELLYKPFNPSELRSSVCRVLGLPEDDRTPFSRRK